MIKFKLALLLMLAAATMSLHAQTKYSVKGSVVDNETGDALMGATVQLLNVPDSSFVTGSAADELGGFVFHNVTKKRYLMKISTVGYVTKYVSVNLADKKGRVIDLGYMTMSSDERMLKEVTITANAAKVQASGDSLVFNASAYRVSQGSTLEELVKLLPGAEVDDDGNITINGKTVTKILVDGKEFFLNDKTVALKNIPVDIIDKIKSYERKSDQARVTGIDDGEEETVLDLSVKKGMRNGWFGNVNAVLGTKHRYDSRTMVNHFNDHVNVSVLGSARNTPDRWGWNRNNGLTSNKEVGANFSTQYPKLETNGSVRYNYYGNDHLSESSSQNFAAERGAFSMSRNQSYASNGNLNLQGMLEWKPDTMTNIIFRPNFSYSRNRGMSSSRSGSYDSDPELITSNALDYNNEISMYSAGDLSEITDEALQQLLDVVVNTNTTMQQSYSTNSSINGELQANRKLNNKGRNITVRVSGGYTEGNSKQLSAANITYNTLGTQQLNNRYYYTPSKDYKITGMVMYSEPIMDRTYLQLSYRYRYSYSKNDRKAQVYDSDAYRDLEASLQNNRFDIESVLRFMDQAGYMLRDTVELSQFSEYRNYNQTISLQLRRVREKYNVTVGVDALPQRTTLNYRYMGKEYPEVTRNVFNLAPRVNLRVNFSKNTNLQFRYNGRTSQPSMTNLLDITDDSNPLNISKGNPGLKPAFSHNFNGNFHSYSAERQRNVWSWLWGGLTNNSISNKTTYDRVTGVRTTMPMNINGNWNIGGGVGMNTALGEKKLFQMGGNIGGSFSNNVGFYNNATVVDDMNIKSITKNSRLNAGINGSFRNDWANIELRGRVNYSHMTNNVNPNANQNTYDFSYGTNLQFTLPWNMQINTDCYMNSRRGYSASEMNTNELLWNASISQSFFKGNALTLKAEVFDILGQQTNISRAVNAFSRTDSRNNSLYQYAMFSAIYRFSIFAGKNTMGTDREKR